MPTVQDAYSDLSAINIKRIIAMDCYQLAREALKQDHDSECSKVEYENRIQTELAKQEGHGPVDESKLKTMPEAPTMDQVLKKAAEIQNYICAVTYGTDE